MLFLYDMPGAMMGLIVVGATLAVVLCGYAVARYLKLMELNAEQRGMTLSMVSIVTTVNSLLVAFAAINVWNAYNDADLTVIAEAACAGELARDLAAFHTRAGDETGVALRGYVQAVIQQEWPAMRQHAHADPQTGRRFDVMFDAVNRIEPADARQDALLVEVLARANEMVKHRQRRLGELEVAMPNTLWAVILITSALSFALLYVLPATPFHTTLIASWAVTLGLAIFFVLSLDRPFAGDVSVSPAPFQHVVDSLVSSGIWPQEALR